MSTSPTRTPDFKRQILISGGFLNNMASAEDPKAFVYAFDGGAFPNVPLIQPRLNSVEEWRFVNHNNDEHPIHVHVNDFQVTEYFDPTTGLRTGPDKFAIDNANAPAPTMQSDETVIQPGILAIRTRFDEYTGLYVMHCHRLNHEDNGLMSLINVIPAVSIYAVAIPGAPGKPAEVRLYDGNGDRFIGTIIPFPGFEGSVNVAMGDVDGDGVLDLIVGAGKDHAPEVVVYAGAAIRGKGAFGTELARFQAFDAVARGGVSVAAAQIDGTTFDNIIVGSGPGIPSEVKVYQFQLLSSSRATPSLFSTFKPYGEDRSGVNVAAGFVDFSTGRESIVTAPGPGSPAEVKVFAFPLLKPIGKASQTSAPAAETDQPLNTATFIPFGKDYRGGASLATGWLAGCAWRRQAHYSQPARGQRFGKGLLERLGAGRGPVTLSAEPPAPRSRRRFPRDRQLHAIRWSCRRAGRHNQYDDGRQPAGQWYCGRRLGGKRPQIRLRQTERPVDNTASRAGRKGLVREDVAASPPRQQLALLFRVAAQLSGIRAPSFLQLLGIVKIRRADPAASQRGLLDSISKTLSDRLQVLRGISGMQPKPVCKPSFHSSPSSAGLRPDSHDRPPGEPKAREL